MRKDKKTEKEYSSFDEYKKNFFPNTDDNYSLQADDPRNLGINMARESLNKFKRLLTKK